MSAPCGQSWTPPADWLMAWAAPALSVPDQQPPGHEEDEGQREDVDQRAEQALEPRQLAGIREVVGGALPHHVVEQLCDGRGQQLVAEDHHEQALATGRGRLRWQGGRGPWFRSRSLS